MPPRAGSSRPSSWKRSRHDRRRTGYGKCGTDSAALPAIVEERRWFYLTIPTWQRILAPVAIGLVVLGLWEFVVWKADVPYYILPGPWRIFRTLITDWGTLSGSLLITLQITGLALLAAVVLGIALSVRLPSPSGWRCRSFPTPSSCR